MKKIITITLFLLAASYSRAQDPLLPLRVELDATMAAANSLIYVKFLIHDGDTNHVLWTNSMLTPNLDPLYGTPVRLSSRTLYVLLGDTSLGNMEPLPKDLFSEGSLRKLRIWISNREYANYRLLTPDLDLVPAPYALRSEESKGFDAETFAQHSSGIAELTSSLAVSNARITGLQNVCKGLTNGTLEIDSPYSKIAQSIVTGGNGEYVYKASSPMTGPASPPTLPKHFDISYTTHFASRFRTKSQANVKSVTLYFKNASEIAPPEAVCVFRKTLAIDVIFYAVSVVTTAFPRCVYTFSNNTNIIPGEYLVGLRKTPMYQTLHPYVCPSYRGNLSYYRYDEPDMGETIFANPPPSVSDYWKFSTSEEELWSQIAFKGDSEISLSKEGTLSVSGSNAVTEGTLAGKMDYLLGRSVFIGRDDLDPAFLQELITSSGGTVTGTLTVADLRLPTNGNWYVGSASKRCDLVIANSSACLRADAGDLVLASSQDIKPVSFVDFSANQGGRADITSGETEVMIYYSGLSESSVILLTPLQETNVSYWVRIDPDGSASICISEAQEDPLSFSYVLIRK
ncbi:hypothetical protein J6T93_04845 [bacterium]|nr:hypothetical protein [bacterium]